ncbi:hypothetical protein PVIIG_05665 [Plasmodium vivax India VII]|uniref:Variable surface protein Vir18 n=1 Tax=Plasmodium vivax India VII TaxID=1077284 RepID=A0A0J9SIX0_PLAVI|nr:hypothetical protein PVIIG_05665 [Plasmodium vivax India VII]
MGYGWQHTRRVNDMFQRFQGPTCTSNYINTKNEIEQKINTFNYKDPNSYCRRCNEIKKNITEKTGELQYCYDTDKIKEFIDKCPDPPKCRYPPNKPVRKPDVSKGQESDSCTGQGKCKEKIVTQVEPKSKAAPGITAGISQARRSEVKVPLKEDPGHSNGDELKSGKVISQTKPEANPLGDSISTQDEGSESTFNRPSVSTEETVTPMQYVSLPSTFTSTELGTTPSAISSQSSVTRDSHSSSNTQVEHLNKGGPTTNIDGVQTDSNNQLQKTPIVAQNIQGLAKDKVDVIETSVETVSGSTSPRGEEAHYEESRSEETSDRVTSDQTRDAVVDRGNTDSTGSQIKVTNSEGLGVRDESYGITTNESIQHTNGYDVDNTIVEVTDSELTSENTYEKLDYTILISM